MRSHEEDVAEAIIEAVFRSLWAFRVELILVGTFGGLGLLANHLLGAQGAWLALAWIFEQRIDTWFVVGWLGDVVAEGAVVPPGDLGGGEVGVS